MLRTNLSTRPFYNQRVVFAGIGLLAVLAVALTAFNAAEILSLTSRNGELVARAEASEARANDLRGQARQTQQALNKQELESIQAAAREANQLIDRRAFSWTTLFNQFEDTLPTDVRILGVAPQIDRDGRMLVAITAIARRSQDLDTFIERLEETGAFSGVLPRTDETLDDGMTKAVLQGYYAATAEPAKAASSPPASDSSEAAGNRSPANASPAAAGVTR